MATPELGRPFEQSSPSPVKREQTNQTKQHRLPRNPIEFLIQCNLNLEERIAHAKLYEEDGIQAQEEHDNLLIDPIYTRKAPTGDGSVVIIVPGYFRRQGYYDDAITCFNNAGYKALVMPSYYGINVMPSGTETKLQIDFIQEAYDSRKRPIYIVGHSKGVPDVGATAMQNPKQFEQVVAKVFKVDFPDEISWANDEVLCRPNLAWPLYTPDSLKKQERFANFLNKVVPTVANMNPEDKVIQGESNAGKVIKNSGSHRGALSYTEIIRSILEGLPNKSSLPVPTAA